MRYRVSLLKNFAVVVIDAAGTVYVKFLKQDVFGKHKFQLFQGVRFFRSRLHTCYATTISMSVMLLPFL